MTTYLERWFDVTSVDCEQPQDHLPNLDSLTALVLSDEFACERASALEEQARRSNPDLIAVRTGTETGVVRAPDTSNRTARLEKPFELAQLARLLGVPEVEIPH